MLFYMHQALAGGLVGRTKYISHPHKLLAVEHKVHHLRKFKICSARENLKLYIKNSILHASSIHKVPQHPIINNRHQWFLTR
ncbi:hypothetical protein Hanom_Chr04g00289581 [Helianthus anomalus]